MSFDSNSWYNLRAVAVGSSRSVQWCSLQIVCNSDTHVAGTNASWQLIALDPTDASKLTLRNLGKGPDSALAVFLNDEETQPGFAPLELHDPTQQWNVSSIEAGNTAAYSIGNVANGTNYRMAERGNPMFMAALAPNVSFMIEGSGTAQKWVVSKVGEINDAAWSGVPSTSATSTSTSASTTNASATPTSDSSDSTITTVTPLPIENTHKLGGGKIAGIVIGVVAFVLIVATCLFIHRKRVRAKKAEQHGCGCVGWNTSVIAEKPADECVETIGKTGYLSVTESSEMSTPSRERHELSV